MRPTLFQRLTFFRVLLPIAFSAGSVSAAVPIEIIELPERPTSTTTGGHQAKPVFLSERHSREKRGRRVEQMSLEAPFPGREKLRIYTQPDLLVEALPSETDVVIDLARRRAILRVEGHIALESDIALAGVPPRAPVGLFPMTERIQGGKVANFFETKSPYWMRLGDSDFGLHADVLRNYPWAEGCIRLPVPAAAWIFQLTQHGSPVRIYQKWDPAQAEDAEAPEKDPAIQLANWQDRVRRRPAADIREFPVGSQAPGTDAPSTPGSVEIETATPLPPPVPDNIASGLEPETPFPSRQTVRDPQTVEPVDPAPIVEVQPATSADPGKTLILSSVKPRDRDWFADHTPSTPAEEPSPREDIAPDERGGFVKRLTSHFPDGLFQNDDDPAPSRRSGTNRSSERGASLARLPGQLLARNRPASRSTGQDDLAAHPDVLRFRDFIPSASSPSSPVQSPPPPSSSPVQDPSLFHGDLIPVTAASALDPEDSSHLLIGFPDSAPADDTLEAAIPVPTTATDVRDTAPRGKAFGVAGKDSSFGRMTEDTSKPAEEEAAEPAPDKTEKARRGLQGRFRNLLKRFADD